MRRHLSGLSSSVEDRRDDPELDGRLEDLERAVAALIDTMRQKTPASYTRRAEVNDAESPLGWLKSRKDRNGRPLITDDPISGRYQAGERVQADYWFAHLGPRVRRTGGLSAVATLAQGGAAKLGAVA